MQQRRTSTPLLVLALFATTTLLVAFVAAESRMYLRKIESRLVARLIRERERGVNHTLSLALSLTLAACVLLLRPCRVVVLCWSVRALEHHGRRLQVLVVR